MKKKSLHDQYFMFDQVIINISPLKEAMSPKLTEYVASTDNPSSGKRCEIDCLNQDNTLDKIKMRNNQ